MSNSDDKEVEGTSCGFFHGNHLNYSEHEKNLNLEAHKLNCAGTFTREAQSIQHLTAHMLNQQLKLVCLTKDVENGAADAYFDIDPEDDLAARSRGRPPLLLAQSIDPKMALAKSQKARNIFCIKSSS